MSGLVWQSQGLVQIYQGLLTKQQLQACPETWEKMEVNLLVTHELIFLIAKCNNTSLKMEKQKLTV